MTDASQKSRNRRRLHITFAVLLAAAIGWILVEHYVIRVDRYRPRVVAELEKATGLSVSIAKLDLAVLPWPRLHLLDVSLGESDFRVAAPRVTLDVELRALFNGVIHIEKIDIVEPEARVPEDFADLQSRIDLLAESLGAPKGESTFELSAVDSIELTWLRAYRGAVEDPLLKAHVDLNDALDQTISLRLQTDIPSMGDSAQLELEAALTRGGTSGKFSAIEAVGSLKGFEFAKVLSQVSSDATLHASFTANGTGFDYVKVEVDGNVESRSTSFLEGSVASEVWWDHGTLTLNELAYDAEGVQARVDATRHESGEIVAKIASLVLTQQALSSLLVREDIRIEAADGARFKASDVLVSTGEGLPLRFVEGQATFKGLDILTNDGDAITLAMRGALEAKDESIQVSRLEGDGFALSGLLRPDWDANALFVEASGDVDLSRARLGAFLKTDELEDITGMVALERLAGTVSGGGGVPEDFALDGTLRDGAFVLATADLRDRFRRVAATFSTDTDGVEMDMNAVSERFGDVAAAGRFLFGEVAWSGLVTCDVARVAGEFIKTAEQRRYALPLLAQYGESRLLTSILFPREGEDRMSISVRRDAEPMLAAEVVLAPSDFGLAPDSIEGKARVELAPLNEALPFDAVLLGQTTVSFDKKPGVETFLVRADLTHSSVRANEYVSKRAGDPLVATLTGAVDQGSWRAKALTIEALGERVALAFGEERLIALEIDVNLTPLSRLLPEGATAGGRVHGSFSLSPFAAALDLEQVAFAIDEELRLDSVNGSLSVDGGYFRCRNLKIRGARSDCIVNADFRGKRWEGELAGQRLDVDAVLVLVGAAQAFGGHPAGDSLEERPAEPTEGEFVVRLNELYYGGVRIDNLRAKVQADAKAIGVTGISLSPGSGNLTGAVTFSRVDGRVENIVADFQLQEIDLQFVDDMILKEPRGIRGIVTGSVSGDAPFGTGREIVAGATGTIQLSGRDGSLGKSGVADTVVKILKTTEIFALKMPSFKNNGLTYDTASTKLRLDNGVMGIYETVLGSTSYAMDIGGSIDFANDSSDVVVVARVLESISSLVERVPGLRDVVSAGTDLAAVRVRVTGSPYEPEVGVIGGASAVKPIQKVTNKLRRLVQ